MNYKLFRQWNLHDLSHHPTGGPSMCKFKYFPFYRNFIFLPILQISRVSKMLADEYGTASNIKSRVNRLMLLLYLFTISRHQMVISCNCHILCFQAVGAGCYHFSATQAEALHQGAIFIVCLFLCLFYNFLFRCRLMDWSSTVALSSPMRGRRRRSSITILAITFLHLSFFFQVNIDFEPFKPINTSLYLCDNKFHTGWLVNLIPLAFASNNDCSLYKLKKSPCLFSYCSLLTRGSDGATS